MQEDIDLYLESAEEDMQNAIAHMRKELLKIRTGKASPAILDGIFVEYYGSPTPLKQVANVKIADARTLTIEPWERKLLSDIERAIFSANLGLTPQNDGKIIRINMPPLTEERRRDLVKKSKGFGEKARISIRQARQEAIKAIKDTVKEGYPEDAGKKAETTIQDLTNSYNKKVEAVLEAKEKDIMTV